MKGYGKDVFCKGNVCNIFDYANSWRIDKA